ncbi:hypothetical protein SRHO_G00173560 [Serrasalmus rhombeus]
MTKTQSSHVTAKLRRSGGRGNDDDSGWSRSWRMENGVNSGAGSEETAGASQRALEWAGRGGLLHPPASGSAAPRREGNRCGGKRLPGVAQRSLRPWHRGIPKRSPIPRPTRSQSTHISLRERERARSTSDAPCERARESVRVCICVWFRRRDFPAPAPLDKTLSVRRTSRKRVSKVLPPTPHTLLNSFFP